jgi:hypothetical protein
VSDPPPNTLYSGTPTGYIETKTRETFANNNNL